MCKKHPLACILRFFVSHEKANSMGVRSIRDERIEAVLAHVSGHLLDVGCGEGNALVRRYAGKGVGVDVYPWDGTDIVCDTKNMPLDDVSFDTVTMVAVLNHIPQRLMVLKECVRVLRPGGKIIITMLTPFIGKVRHKMAWWDKDQHERGMDPAERYGLKLSYVTDLLVQAGFTSITHRRFLLGLNHLIIAFKGE